MFLQEMLLEIETCCGQILTKACSDDARGMVCIGLKRFGKALELLQQVRIAPVTLPLPLKEFRSMASYHSSLIGSL